MKRKTIILTLVAVVLLMQLIRIDRKPPVFDEKKDILISTEAPENIHRILKRSCYDCHSYETKYPWYSAVAPVSWMLKLHVNEGREHLNFSNWQDYSPNVQNGYKTLSIKEIKNNKMPLISYTLIHSEAKLTDQTKKELMSWFEQ